MPHITVQYTPNVDADMTALCSDLARTIVAQRDADGKPVFPVGGTRVLAYPAAHYAVADGAGDYAFVYVNVRIATGRSEAQKKAVGDALLAAVQARFADLFARALIGITLQIDEPAVAYDAKHSTLHAHFRK